LEIKWKQFQEGVESMSVPDINGPWLSKKGQLVYVITQLDDKFVWRVVHTNGVIEAGIGWFPGACGQDLSLTVEAKWNFHGGQLNAGIRGCSGTVVMAGGQANEILWSDRDHFQRVP
jgi:hypothetical protein